MRKHALATALVTWLTASGCGSDPEQASERARSQDEQLFGQNPSCEQVYRLDASAPLDRLDLLLVLDATPSLAASRAALAAALPALVRLTATGDLDGDGSQDMPAFNDVHAAVVTSDLGTGEVPVPGCTADGDAAMFRDQPVAGGGACDLEYPPFLLWGRDAIVTGAGVHLGCLADVGDAGCGYTQPLAAAVRALRDNSVETAGGRFLRGASTPSVLGVLVLTDRDDCSAEASAAHLLADAELAADDARLGLDPPARCAQDAAGLLEVQALVNDLQRSGSAGSDRVVFTAIAGVPAELVSHEKLEPVSWNDDEVRAAFYAELLDDPRMLATVDPDTHTLTESCRGPGGSATPPRRLVETAQAFGARGLVQSLCQEDLTDALRLFARSLADAARPTCLSPVLTRSADGLVRDCDVVWQLPSSFVFPSSCGEVFGSEAAGVTPTGRRRCRLPQVTSDSVATAAWYLQDSGKEVEVMCPADRPRRIAFATAFLPPPGTLVTLECGCDIRD
jgi:hypothetical protein